MKAAIEQMCREYAFSERRACALMLVAISTYRYRSRRFLQGNPGYTRSDVLRQLERMLEKFGLKRETM